MNHASLGQIDFTAAGRIFDGGFLRAIEDTQRLAGAVSYDGLEAGWPFENKMVDGTLSGLLFGTVSDPNPKLPACSHYFHMACVGRLFALSLAGLLTAFLAFAACAAFGS